MFSKIKVLLNDCDIFYVNSSGYYELFVTTEEKRFTGIRLGRPLKVIN